MSRSLTPITARPVTTQAMLNIAVGISAVLFAWLSSPSQCLADDSLADSSNATVELRPYVGGPIATTSPFGGPIELQLDDGTTEGQSGVNGAEAVQFMWFSQFAAPGQTMDLEEIQVLFPAGANMVVGAAVQLVVLSDNDGDPTNGASLLAAFDETIQTVDGAMFSVFPIAPAVSLQADEEILIGVVPRFITSGVTSPTFPAAVDTSTSQGRSWIATWTGDPPLNPSLPSDDVLIPINGNWMIRGFGSPGAEQPPILEVPSLSSAGLVLLAGCLLISGLFMRRRSGSV